MSHKKNLVDHYLLLYTKFVDHYFQQHGKTLPSYINDTSDFIHKISETENIKIRFLLHCMSNRSEC